MLSTSFFRRMFVWVIKMLLNEKIDVSEKKLIIIKQVHQNNALLVF